MSLYVIVLWSTTSRYNGLNMYVIGTIFYVCVPLCMLVENCHGMDRWILKYIFASRKLLFLLEGWRSGCSPTWGVAFQIKLTVYRMCVLTILQ